MNVAIFASAFYPSIGGVEELVRQLAHEYRRRGIETIVITNRWPRTLPRHEMYEGIPVYRIAMRVPDFSFKIKLNYWLTSHAVEAQMVGILKRHRIDLIHVQCIGANGFYALKAKRALGLPVVATAQGERTMDANQLYARSSFQNGVLRKIIEEADYVTACSRNTLTDLEEYRGEAFVSKGTQGVRASVIYNGIRVEDFRDAKAYPHERPYILGIGRLVPQKGFDVLIEAFAKADAESHDLLLAGAGSELAALHGLVEKLNLGGRVHFLGRVDRARAVELFTGCSFFVLPSRLEPMGIVNAEAMVAGKAVIASNTGGVPEVVADGETGLLVAPGDADALAVAIRKLAGDEALRERLGAAGRRRVEKFTWAAVATEYMDIYCGVLNGSPLAETA